MEDEETIEVEKMVRKDIQVDEEDSNEFSESAAGRSSKGSDREEL